MIVPREYTNTVLSMIPKVRNEEEEEAVDDPSTPGNTPPLITTEFVIVPGPDGEQWLSEPDGDRPIGVDPVEPVSNLKVEGTPTTTTIRISWTYSDTNHTRFEVDMFIDNGASTTWSRVATLGPTERSYTGSNLPPNTRIGFRVRAANDE